VKVETPAGVLNVRTTGNGKAGVLVLHPLALSGEVWAPMAAALGAEFTVLALDARGHGDSQWDGKPFTVEELADDAAAVIRAHGTGPVGVVGMSMGGSTAVSLAVRYPDLVDRLVLADATACYGPDRVEAWAERARGAASKTREEQIPFQLTRWFSDGFNAEHGNEAQRVVDIFLATDRYAHAAACEALGGFDASAELGSIAAPTLVLVGDEDYATPPAMAEELAAGIPGARLELLLQTRHLSLVERPDVWPTIAAHLRGTE
jgi:3-oxoadipate enol-lactonase